MFSGTACTGGEAQGVVFATGMHTELGRIASLSERVKEEPSPLERQVRRVAWLIAGVALAMAVAFIPLAIFGAGLSLQDSVVFAVGLLAGNVPEGLLPVITLALAVAVSALARRGALVKRLSAVETLGSTDVICTDKTGTLTENRMQPRSRLDARRGSRARGRCRSRQRSVPRRRIAALAETAAACNNARARLRTRGTSETRPRWRVLIAARALGADVDHERREQRRRYQYNFDPELKLMSTLDARMELAAHEGGARVRASTLHVHPRQPPVSPSRSTEPRGSGSPRRWRASRAGDCACWRSRAGRSQPATATDVGQPARDRLERELCLLGLVTMFDPPRAEVREAVARCHSAGIRIIVITGDHPLTAAAIARQVGHRRDEPPGGRRAAASTTPTSASCESCWPAAAS